MKIECQDNERQRGYSKPVCSMIEVVEEEMIAASPDPPTPPEKPELKSPTGETTDPNTAKRYPSFNAWTTWD